MTKNQKLLASGICLAVIVAAMVIAYVTYKGRGSQRIVESGNNSSIVKAGISEAGNSLPAAKSEQLSFQYDDEKHRLFQAAGATEDKQIVQVVLRKTGLLMSDGKIANDYQKFIEEHFRWALKNPQFVSSIKTPQDARVYLSKHIEIPSAPTNAP